MTENLEVGDLIRIRDNTIIPADCAILSNGKEEGKED